jgi:hypothetical protein
MAEFAPDRVNHLVIGGQHPYARNAEGWRQLACAGIEQGPNAFLTGFEEIAGTPPPGYRARLLESDYRAFLAIAQDRTSIESVLQKIAVPCCVYVGEGDRLFEDTKRASERIRNAEFFRCRASATSRASCAQISWCRASGHFWDAALKR